jgi:hypothetical protein
MAIASIGPADVPACTFVRAAHPIPAQPRMFPRLSG